MRVKNQVNIPDHKGENFDVDVGWLLDAIRENVQSFVPLNEDTEALHRMLITEQWKELKK